MSDNFPLTVPGVTINAVQSCGTCKFGGRANYGECRRHAPVTYVAPALGYEGDGCGELRTRWPSVGPHDWCGDYEPDARSLEGA